MLQVNRAIASSEASGEYIGVARFNAESAASLQETYHRMKTEFDGKIWKDDTPFAKAYLIHLYQEMLAAGSPFHMVATDGEYMEIDTEEDFELANERWPGEYGV